MSTGRGIEKQNFYPRAYEKGFRDQSSSAHVHPMYTEINQKIKTDKGRLSLRSWKVDLIHSQHFH